MTNSKAGKKIFSCLPYTKPNQERKGNIMSQNVQLLFAGAKAGGDIGAGTLKVLAIPDLGAQIQAGLGAITPDDVGSSEVTLVTLLIDDSGSIQSAGNEQMVRDGANLIIKALSDSKQADSVLISIRYLNGNILFPYVLLKQAILLDGANYAGTGGTPLYDQSVVTLGQVLAKAQEFSDGGIVCRSVSAIITDGADMSSRKADAKDVAKVVNDMRRSENHIVIGMGINDGYTDFQQVFSEMGIDPKWVLTPGNTGSEIRKAFAVVSQSAVRASQSAKSFSQAAGAGFTV